jgi:hypothetical protein
MTLEHTILKANDNLTIDVEFKNPNYTGKFLVEEEYEEEIDGEKVTKKRWVDNDPHPHTVKTIRVPLTDKGKVDHEELQNIIAQQGMGVKNRMETKAAEQKAGKLDLAKALGL